MKSKCRPGSPDFDDFRLAAAGRDDVAHRLVQQRAGDRRDVGERALRRLGLVLADDTERLAPAAIPSMLRRRNSSRGAPVRTWMCQGCVFIDDGARLATSMISSMTARGTGCFLKPRTLLRV
jgi:hypothetical protein